MGAASKVAGVDAGALDTAVGIVGVFLNEIIVQLDQVGQAAFHNIIGIQQQADRIRVGISKGLEGIELGGEKLDKAVRHGAHGLDLCAELHLGQTVGRADAAAQHCGVSTIVASALALCTAGAELHDAAGGVGVQTGDAGGLGGDQAMEVHGLQQVGLDEDRAHQIALDAHHLYMGVADRALGQGVHIALPLVGAQILAELLAHALGAQPVDILLVEVIVQQKAGQLALACADRIALIVRVLAEEHIKHQCGILKAMQEQAVCHGEFVKIHHHRGVIVVLIGDIRLNLDLVHECFPLYLYPASVLPYCAPPAACPAGGSAALS